MKHLKNKRNFQSLDFLRMSEVQGGIMLNPKQRNKQKGATLVSALTFLVLMTVVSVSAMKVSILDILVAGNDQKKSLTYLSAETALALNVNYFVVYKESPDLTKHNGMDSKVVINKDGKDRCRGILGHANSIGGHNTPDCQIYTINSKGYKQGSVISDTHVRSVGRQVPKSNYK